MVAPDVAWVERQVEERFRGRASSPQMVVVPAVDGFPRRQKFVLGDRIQRTALAVLEVALSAESGRRKGGGGSFVALIAGDTERLSVWPVWRCRGVMLRRFFMFAGLLVLPVLLVGESWAEVRAEGSEAQTEPVTPGGKRTGLQPGETFWDCPTCPQMVVVPAGSFLMGALPDEEGQSITEGPVHEVRIAEPFAVGVYEVTRGEYGRFVAATGYAGGKNCDESAWERRTGRSWRAPGFEQTDREPVVCVSWQDAQAYAAWLSGETGQRYRLLSEAEWEYVARAGTQAARYWGESESGQCRNANGSDSGVGCHDGHAHTAPVGTYWTNSFGLHDMLGNVAEWVEDCWNGYYHEGAPEDGRAWESGDCIRRVQRGGSWHSFPSSLRSAHRRWGGADYQNSDVGFRLARSLPPLGGPAGEPAPEANRGPGEEAVAVEPPVTAASGGPDPAEAEQPVPERTGRRVREPFRDCPTCPQMVVVPVGSFMMGSLPDEDIRDDAEGPVHQVTIAEPFAVGVYEVTFGDWDACVRDGGCNGYRPDDEGWGRGRRPVINVNWADAQAYVRWLSGETGQRYRLLSEAEWEYVTRAGTTVPFHFGKTIHSRQANYNGYETYTYRGGGDGEYRWQTVPVGSFGSNAFGLYDVHGNVDEWVQDCWNEDYRGAPSDGRAWEGGDCGQRVLRGGSWQDYPWGLRSASRSWSSVDERRSINGFRLARSLQPPVGEAAVALPSTAEAADPDPAEVEAGLELDREARRQVQHGLIESGRAPGPAHGWFGGETARTRQAIRAWQAAQGMVVSGYLTQEQVAILMKWGRTRADDAAYAEAERVNTAESYAEYMRAYLSGRHGDVARERQAERAAAERRMTLERTGWRVGETFRDALRSGGHGPQMVVVPAGSFLMGSSASEAGRDEDEGPVHRATIAQPFAVGVYEVTVGEFKRFALKSWSGIASYDRVKLGGCTTHERGKWRYRETRDWKDPGFEQTDWEPVVCVSWQGAQAYAAWLSGETGQAYRLLSEAEWEYVARAGTRTARYWGERESGQCGYANGTGSSTNFDGRTCHDGYARTAPVRSYEANGFGLYDVLGNVWEWVQDCWNPHYQEVPSDGRAWESEDCSWRVRRGGSWDDGPRHLRSANRDRYYAEDHDGSGWISSASRDSCNGFRLARSLP